MTPEIEKLIEQLRRIGSQQAGALTSEAGEVWHPANLLLEAAAALAAQQGQVEAALAAVKGVPPAWLGYKDWCEQHATTIALAHQREGDSK